jgi:glycosyltransferase involved in cell wall biosynthesis
LTEVEELPHTISVIVPVYNVEGLLPRCADSILSQTFEDIELILVDDGATDKSGAVCDEYAKRDGRVKVLHMQNGGPSAARNAGLAAAGGEYIGFVDSDDWIEPEMYDNLLGAARRSGSDVVFGDFIMETGSGAHTVSMSAGHAGNYYDRSGIISDILPYFWGFGDGELENYRSLCPIATTCSYVWLCLYKASVIREGNIEFPSEKLYYNEDNLFNLLFFLLADSASYAGGALYHYYSNPGSFTASFSPDFLNAKLNKYEFLRSRAALCPAEGLEKRLENKTALESGMIVNYYAGRRGLTLREKTRWVKKILDSPEIAKSLAVFPSGAALGHADRLYISFAKKKAALPLAVMSGVYGRISARRKG